VTAPAILLAGPTASGKSALAMAIAARLPVEIVSVDSAQVYRGMDVGTAKPSRAERLQVPHHLVDVVDPVESYSAARFRADALACIADIRERGRVPLLVGGTMLYFKALVEGLADLPAADPGVRAALDREAAARGWPALHADLARVDPATAARLEPADAQRIQRALEVYRLTGRPLSVQLARRAGHDAFAHVALALVPPDRAVLHARIAGRFDAMLAAGLVEELAALRARFALHEGLPSMRCVGYRQAWAYLDGRCTRAELRDRGVFATRQLAKRQLTWLRAMTRFEAIDPLAADAPQALLARIEMALSG
jgi:tRNA dimethylallyltransferase